MIAQAILDAVHKVKAFDHDKDKDVQVAAHNAGVVNEGETKSAYQDKF